MSHLGYPRESIIADMYIWCIAAFRSIADMHVETDTILHVCVSHNVYQPERADLEVNKRLSYSTQLRTKFIVLINVKRPTIVGILTFIDMIEYHI